MNDIKSLNPSRFRDLKACCLSKEEAKIARQLHSADFDPYGKLAAGSSATQRWAAQLVLSLRNRTRMKIYAVFE